MGHQSVRRCLGIGGRLGSPRASLPVQRRVRTSTHSLFTSFLGRPFLTTGLVHLIHSFMMKANALSALFLSGLCANALRIPFEQSRRQTLSRRSFGTQYSKLAVSNAESSDDDEEEGSEDLRCVVPSFPVNALTHPPPQHRSRSVIHGECMLNQRLLN